MLLAAWLAMKAGWAWIPAPVKKGVLYLGIVVVAYLGFRWWLRLHDNKVAETAKYEERLKQKEIAASEQKALLDELNKKIAEKDAQIAEEIRLRDIAIAKAQGEKTFAKKAYDEQVKIASEERRLRDEQVPTIHPSEYAATVRARMRELMSSGTSTGTGDKTGEHNRTDNPPNR